jgi:23S rRNA (cytidine1920-2'-O)/16S rRNA (cytidine1409-2'-O)-methyltransferase
MARKVRLDQLLVQRGIAETPAKAQALILAGAVRLTGVAHSRPGDKVAEDVSVELVSGMPYVSRGGYKLAHALDTFGLSPAGLVALDVGASTGGFTDVLVQRGAARVYAVDVGYGILDWRLRQDQRVVVVERTNIRFLEALPAPHESTQAGKTLILADCATIDVAFISLQLVLPAVQRLVQPNGWIVALIKPQFEAETADVDRGSGVIRDPELHRAVVRNVLRFAMSLGLVSHGLARSPITGPAGNVEFLVWLGGDGPELAVDAAIRSVVMG